MQIRIWNLSGFVKQIIRRISQHSLDEKSVQSQHPVLRHIYTLRNIARSDELDNSIRRLIPPLSLRGLDAALELLVEVITDGQRILIVGDFDADGATSSALMVLALRSMGAAHVDYLVPDRFKFGYGLTAEIVEVAKTMAPDLILTVDNGISSIDGVAAAKAAGIRVLVTDHHLPGEQLPAADAIVNPNQPGDEFPSKNLAGVGVAFYLLSALRSRLRQQQWFEQQGIEEPNMADYLDLVALGTVADLVPLDHNNRILVEQGLRRIRAGHCRPGIAALLSVAGKNARRLVASDFGFGVGPRLNAAGRLDDMSLGIECLLSTEPSVAEKYAVELDALNRERREIEQDMKEQAMQYVGELQLDEQSLPSGLCLYNPDWHQGVIGILASRIKEKFHRPVIAFARGLEGELKGSARSIPGLHIRDALAAIAARHPDLIHKFGGHAMAAGLSLGEDDFVEFRDAFEAELDQHLDAASLTGQLETDGELNTDDFSLELAELLRTSGPWGQGFPEPLFDGVFILRQQRILGGKHIKMSVSPQQGKQLIDAIAFNQADDHQLSIGQPVRLVYRLDSNEFRGNISLQLMVEYIEPAGIFNECRSGST